MTGTPSSGGLAAYAESIRLSPDQVCVRLSDLLGAKLVAYLGSVRETSAVRQWAAGERVPSDDVVLRLRTAYHAAVLVREKETARTVQAWFCGMNPRLNDVAPARLLREGDLDEVGPQVVAAARSLATGA